MQATMKGTYPPCCPDCGTNLHYTDREQARLNGFTRQSYQCEECGLQLGRISEDRGATWRTDWVERVPEQTSQAARQARPCRSLFAESVGLYP